MDDKPNWADIQAELRNAREVLAGSRGSRPLDVVPPALPDSLPKLGVENADSWARFEARARERRIARCAATARAALRRRKLTDARVAIDEIHELDPHHAQLSSLQREFRAAEFRAQTHHRTGPALAAAAAFAAALLLTTQVRNDQQPSAPLSAVQFAGFSNVVEAPPPIEFTDSAALEPIEETVPSGAVDAQPAAPIALATTFRSVVETPSRPVDSAPTPSPASPPPAVGSSPATPERVEAVVPIPPPPAPRPAVMPATSSPEVVASAAPPPAVAVAAPPPAVTTSAVPTNDAERSIRQVLDRYRAAYEKLDARSAQQIWPAVNESALARAFTTLKSQSLTFEQCDVRISGATATAECIGSAQYVPRIGSQQPRSESRVWDFSLRQAGTEWKIESARVDR